MFDVNVNDYIEERKGLKYLSWSHAITEVKKRYPSFNYRVLRFENNLPYVFDPKTGYMVFTEVTIEGITHEMWLPVMDTSNKAMKDVEYTYDTQNRKGIKVKAATMFDINKAIMRCIVKNIAAFGLGIYIYNKDDIPEPESDRSEQEAKELKAAIKSVKEKGTSLIANGIPKEKVSEIVSKHNDGNKSPSAIPSKEICEKILEELEKINVKGK